MSARKAKKPALGKGLAALIPAERPSAEESAAGIVNVPIENILPMPGQPRSQFNLPELAELADSIRDKGVIQPILVRRVGERYQLIAGERRWRAAQDAGIHQLPVIVKDVDEDEAFQLALIENIQREDLNPVEVGRALRKLMDDFDLKQEDVSKRIGKNRATVANYLRILKLPPIILRKVEDRTLSFGHARALAALSGKQFGTLDMDTLLAGKLSVRELERLVSKIRETGEQIRKEPKSSKPKESTQVRYVRRRLEQLLGLRVRLKDRGGKGSLTVEYENLEQLEGLLQKLGFDSDL